MKKQWSIAACAALACSQIVWAGATKYFSVLIPPDRGDWMAAVPMISLDGGKTGKPMTPDGWMCGWFTYQFAADEVTDKVIIYRDDDFDREDVLGMNGNWETSESATPIPLKTIFGMGVDSLFFVADENQKTNEDGYYYTSAEAYSFDGTCFYSLSTIVYDTDPSLHPAFSCYSDLGEGCQNGAQGVDSATAVTAVDTCVGITPGIVESTLDATKKPKLTAAGKKCFINEQYFNQLFNYTKNVNEMSCFDMPFYRSLDGKWEFDSDFYMSPGTKVSGGFYPVELSTDSSVLATNPSQTPLAAARTRHEAEGPVFYGEPLRTIDPVEGVPVIDVLCNGPAWDKGLNCEGYFGGGDVTTTFIQKALGLDTGYLASNMPENCVFCWSCTFPESAPEGWIYYVGGTEKPSNNMSGEPRWRSIVKDGVGGRNQHYCMEAHSSFTYKPGLKFSFRASDDLWVFVDNKLAVDLGGTHIPAPAYVDLDKFKGANGALTVGNEYDLDIFFCDRRTAMNGLRIKTNAVSMAKRSSVETKPVRNPKNPAEMAYEICYTVVDGACGVGEATVKCDTLLDDPKMKISYTLVKGKTISSPAVEGFKKVSEPGVYKCGIDLTDLTNPKVSQEKICLEDGSYTLFVNVEDKSSKVVSFNIGSDAVKARRVVAKDFRAFTHGNSIAIVADDNSSAKFTIMNALGSVVRSGNLQQGRAVVQALVSGSYIVKLGHTTRRVNVH